MGAAGSSVRVDVAGLRAAVGAIFASVGCPAGEASLIAEELVLSDQMGLHSHGVLRVAEYLAAVRDGRVEPGGPCSITSDNAGTAVVDGGANFGQVVGRFAVEVGGERARRFGVSCVVTRNSFHLGRLGSLAERAAAAGLISMATVAVGLPGVVAPWGAAEGVLGTNPFSYGIPLDGEPVVTDFATSTMAEGAVRLAMRQGRELPEGMILDAEGVPTTDPSQLFTDPPGSILPFGGPLGYKGYALNALPELTAAALAGYGPSDPARPSNCLLLVLIDPSAFGSAETYRSLAGESAAMISGARPRPGHQVLLPGQREQQSLKAHLEAVDLPAATLEEVRTLAVEAGVVATI